MIVADSGINWASYYEIEYMDEDICILLDLGQFHKYENGGRASPYKAEKWIDIRTFHNKGLCSVIDGKVRLCEIKPNPNRLGR